VSAGSRGAQPVPELVPETAQDVQEPPELTFTPHQWTRFDTTFKRQLAAEANTDVIDGGSTKLEIRAYFVTQRSLTDYTLGE
jgi:hypothetical protein